MLLTSIDRLDRLLPLFACIVLRGLLCSQTSPGACIVEVATVVHGFLEGVAFPTENVVAMRGGATINNVSQAQGRTKRSQSTSTPLYVPFVSAQYGQ